MDSGSSIVNLSDLSKPATVLIEKISGAVGGIFKPYQIVRVAKAEAEADRIRAESHIQISDLHRRAMHRFLEEEARKQKNMEEITRQALPQLNEKSKPDNVGDDWIVNFFDKCRLISDSDMQRLWSRVLAGEANAPGTYSKRTVNSLGSLDKAEASLFTQVCSCGWSIGDDVIPAIFDVFDPVYVTRGINFKSLSHLDSVGLIQFSDLTGFRRMSLPRITTIYYYGTPVRLEFSKDADNEMQIGNVLLTRTGAELAPICGSLPDPEIFEYVVSRWKRMGYIKVDQDGRAPRS